MVVNVSGKDLNDMDLQFKNASLYTAFRFGGSDCRDKDSQYANALWFMIFTLSIIILARSLQFRNAEWLIVSGCLFLLMILGNTRI